MYHERGGGLFDSQMYHQPPPPPQQQPMMFSQAPRNFGQPLPDDLFLNQTQGPSFLGSQHEHMMLPSARREHRAIPRDMLSDSEYVPLSIEDEDDEDYSLKDDLRKNAKIFKDDDESYLKRHTEPILRKEIDELMAESHRPLDPEYQYYSQAYQPNKR